jgi:hypothetical protein
MPAWANQNHDHDVEIQSVTARLIFTVRRGSGVVAESPSGSSSSSSRCDRQAGNLSRSVLENADP